ncbi:extracellular solute-binding protein [Metabacillus arenae]|uniref:Extracellular solute-binding protein n=1 Tax=Metabacillus arenae TaxID=2771434 RepID=A0A926RX26_9BACI|nr:extracellular solute-binding protein [Metabacillus arenae]MBD1380551.1 extracellular solute-binding protein [Metabacillus arenae]
MSEKTSREEFKMKLQQFIETTKEQIVTGKIPIGEYLPAELALAERFDLSKNSVRKGLDELVRQGLIVKKLRIGNLVVSNKPFDQIILRLGYYPSIQEEAVLSKLLRKFEEKYPLIKVQTITLPYDHYHKTVKDFFQNDIVDAVTINYNDYCSLSQSGRELFEPLETDNQNYSFLEKAFLKEELYVKPFIFSPIVLCYNEDHFKKAGLAFPDSGWQWEEVLKTASLLSKEKKHEKHCGFYFHSLSVNRWPIFLLQNQVSFMRDPNGEVSFNKEKFIESVNLCKDIFKEQEIVQNILSDSDKDAEKLFLEGKVSMIMTSYFSLNHMKEAPLNYDIAPLPYLEDARTLLLMIGIAINKHSTKIEAAKLLLNYLTSEECQEIIRTETLSIPAVKHIAERTGGEKVYQPPRFKLFREIIPTFRLYEKLGLSFQELNEIGSELRLYWSGLITEDLLCNRITAKLFKASQENMDSEENVKSQKE